MSTRAKWLAGVGAFALAGLLASIPAFVGGSGGESRSSGPRYSWLARMPLRQGSAPPDPSTRIGTAPDGQQLLATRVGPDQLCMRFGSSGRACEAIDTTKQIQPVARVRGLDGDVLWVVLADDVASLRISHEQGGSTGRFVRHAFGVLEPRGKEAVSIEAQDSHGRVLGTIRGDAFVAVRCGFTSCVTLETR